MTDAAQRWLIVDEYRLTRELAARVLRQRAYTCAVAGTAGDALAVMRSFRPHVVVLDPVFRDGSGRGLSARLRAQASQEGRAVTIVILSAVEQSDATELCDDADHYFLKPTSMSELVRAVSDPAGPRHESLDVPRRS